MHKKQYHSGGGSMSGALVEDAAQDDLVGKGQQFYDRRLKSILEPDHSGRFVAIEPDSAGTF